MDSKPDRRAQAASTAIGTVAGIGLKGALEALPGGSVLFDLLKARRDELNAAMREQAEKRLDNFYSQMLEAGATMDEQQARALLSDADFHALLRACVADIEAEKVGAYAVLARGIATGSVAVKYRRHFILSLRDLSADELACLRKALVARGHKMVPGQGSGEVGESEFLSPGQPGSFQAIHVSNLTAKGYVHEGKLSPLGVTFAQAVWKSEELTPGSLGYFEWSGHHIAIISYEIGVSHVDSIAIGLTDGLRKLRCKSFIAAITRDTQQQARLNATRGILLIGDKVESLAAQLGALTDLLVKVPTVGILVSANAAVPEGLPLLGVVDFDQHHQEDLLSSVCRLLFQPGTHA